MFIATAVVSAVLAACLVFAAVRKLSHSEEVVLAYARAGVPEERLDALAMILFAAAAGLVLGLIWAPVGVAAAIGLILYFAVAVGFHVRAGDLGNVATPLVLELLSVAALVLRLATI